MVKPVRLHSHVLHGFSVSVRCFDGCEHGLREKEVNELKKFKADALGHKILSPEVVIGMVKSSEDMTRTSLQMAIEQLAKSHERLRQESKIWQKIVHMNEKI